MKKDKAEIEKIVFEKTTEKTEKKVFEIETQFNPLKILSPNWKN